MFTRVILAMFVMALGWVPEILCCGAHLYAQSAVDTAMRFLPPGARVASHVSETVARKEEPERKAATFAHLTREMRRDLVLIYEKDGALTLRAVLNPFGQSKTMDYSLPGKFLWTSSLAPAGLIASDVAGSGNDQLIALTSNGASLGALMTIVGVSDYRLALLQKVPIEGYRFELDDHTIVCYDRWTDPSVARISLYGWDGRLFAGSTADIGRYYDREIARLTNRAREIAPVLPATSALEAATIVGVLLRERDYLHAVQVCTELLSAIDKPNNGEMNDDVPARIQARAIVHELLGEVYAKSGDEEHAAIERNYSSRLKREAIEARH